MQMVKVLAVYRVSPLLFVMEAADGTVVELSLKDIEEGGHRLSDAAWRDLVVRYQLFTCQVPRREGARQARSARHHRPATKRGCLQDQKASSTVPEALPSL
jgi:hypothetical protein